MQTRRVLKLANHLSSTRRKVSPGALLRSMSTSASLGDEVLFESPTDTLETIELNRPEKFNALNLNMVRLIKPRYDEWVARKKPMCVLMTSAGHKAFCAGGDIAKVRSSSLEGGTHAVDFFYEEYQLNHRIATAFKRSGLVQVAVWNGITMGGGVGLSIHGKIRVALENTTFAMPETGIGLFPDVGGTYELSRLRTPEIGLYIALSGCRLGAQDCMYSGLATHYIPRDQLPLIKEGLVNLGADAGDYEKVSAFLQKLRGAENPPVEGKVVPVIEPNLEGIERCFNFSYSIEEIMDSLKSYASEKDGDKKEWAEKTLRALESASPISLKLTLKAVQLHSNPSMTIGQALVNEYRMVQRICEHPDNDFFEGVRAILVDKDPKSLKWKNTSVSEVSDAMIQEYFKPFDASHPRGEIKFDN